MAPDGPWEMMRPEDRQHINEIMANVGKAIEAYERKLVSSNSAFEQYVKGNDSALSLSAKRGLKLFIGKAACNECHRGPIMSDNKFHNLGVPQAVGANVPRTDHGRFQDLPIMLANPFNSSKDFSDDPEAGRRRIGMLAQNESMRGQFKTPTLHNISDTAPYFHNGYAKSLEEVVRFYNRGGGEAGTFSGVKDPKMRPLNLTMAEEADLVEFLKHLMGAQVVEEWAADTAKR
jgi:cytochrome c peroxidase